MMPNIFAQCHPISRLEDLEEVLQNQPSWVDRVEILTPRSSIVVPNTISDCHSDPGNFLSRRAQRVDSRCVPKTLICHDYKGGYLADKYLHFPGEEIIGNGYTFYNWSQVDIFVYFSHHFITIPPLSWINAAHKNGVKVLGTLITEFDPGTEICQKIFKNTESMMEFAKSLAKVTKIFGFDGWLLNIENKVEQIETLKMFVPFLSNLIHEDNPGNLVIWYDSVTIHGDLNWQNELNDHNRYFFDSCDGIFLNYTWTEETLMKTSKNAKGRHFDVFVGVDVFGRNMYGGGKMNTYKALKIVKQNNLSLAIFAPGWTHETLEKTENFFEDFLQRDSLFWRSLWPYFYSHPISNYFTTNFCIGLDKIHYNLFNQQQQLSHCLYPADWKPGDDNEQTIKTIIGRCRCLQSTLVDSKNACLITKKNIERVGDYVHNLFICDIEVENNVVVFYLTKSVDENMASLSINLWVSGCNGSTRKILLLDKRKDEPINNSSVLEVNQAESPDIRENIRNRYYKKIQEEQWSLSVYVFNLPLCNILEIGGIINNGMSIYLGAFGVENADGSYLVSA
ncbi:unnamed protein product [Phaedon cochleariae]|uniref:Cytosolic endo-beta-N-acetylglucosaminidase TIM barrel domain-containing protein n=1 Tax=Phaedon cochleariae TaxID=80249 RepID=A0A9P0D8H0_PHACE|nr:unnamed protein product [Phaedon cochleariae]